MRRHRVSVRSKVRGQRTRKAAAVACVAFLGVCAAATIKHMKSEGVVIRDMIRFPVPRTVSVQGAPAPLDELLLAELDAAGPSRDDQSARLMAAFPCLSKVELSRHWLKKEHVYRVTLKSAAAPALRGGKPAGWLGDDGSVFSAPEGLFNIAAPAVDVGSASAQELAGIARFVRAAAGSKSLLSPIARVRYLSPRDGWEVSFEDGVTALWGDLRWTDEKLARLREALLDARGQFPGALAADLRYFEDGRVLLRPGAMTARAGLR